MQTSRSAKAPGANRRPPRALPFGGTHREPVQQTEAERRRGAIYETADGRLRGSILLPLPDGTSKRVYLSGRTRAEITRKLDAKRKESDTGAVTGEDLGAARSILRREIKEEAKLLSEVRVEAPAANRPEEAPAPSDS